MRLDARVGTRQCRVLNFVSIIVVKPAFHHWQWVVEVASCMEIVEIRRAKELSDRAVELALTHRDSEASAVFAEAIAATRSIRGVSHRAIALCELATAFDRANRHDEAKALW